MMKKKQQNFFTLWDLIQILIIKMLHSIKFRIGLFFYKFHLHRIIKRGDWGRK